MYTDKEVIWRKIMRSDSRLCEGCTSGCTERHTSEKVEEEVSAGPYVLFCAVLIIVLSALIKWFL
jgi:hypothetical protein